MRYFKKELVSTPLYLSNGHRLLFQDVGGNTGLLVTDDVRIHEELFRLIHSGRGGISEISQQQAEDLKKNPPRSPNRFQPVFGGVIPAAPGVERLPVVPLGGNAAAAKGIQTFLPPNPGSDSPVTIPSPSDFIPPPPPVGKRSGVIKRSGPAAVPPPAPTAEFPKAA